MPLATSVASDQLFATVERLQQSCGEPSARQSQQVNTDGSWYNTTLQPATAQAITVGHAWQPALGWRSSSFGKLGGIARPAYRGIFPVGPGKKFEPNPVCRYLPLVCCVEDADLLLWSMSYIHSP